MLLMQARWQEVEAYLTRSDAIVIPTGSVEQHGPIGLIGTDAICAAAIAQGMAQQADILVGPEIAFGVAPFNLAFPGTISARPSTFTALLGDYIRSLAKQGFRHFYVLNGHGGNIGPAKSAFLEIVGEWSLGQCPPSQDAPHFRLRSWWEYPQVDALRRQEYGAWEGMHATPSEIAITQALHPDLPNGADLDPPEALSAAYLRDHAGDNHGPAEEHRARFPDGRVGSHSSLATPALGRRLLDLAIADAIADFDAFRRGQDH